MGTTLYDVQLATMKIGQEDTEAGGLVALVGKAVPIKRGRNPDELDPPEVAVRTPAPATRRAGAPDGWEATLDLDVVTNRGSEGLEDEIVERLVEVLTQPKYMAHGVDLRSLSARVRELDGTVKGYRRLLEVDVSWDR